MRGVVERRWELDEEADAQELLSREHVCWGSYAISFPCDAHVANMVDPNAVYGFRSACCPVDFHEHHRPDIVALTTQITK